MNRLNRFVAAIVCLCLLVLPLASCVRQPDRDPLTSSASPSVLETTAQATPTSGGVAETAAPKTTAPVATTAPETTVPETTVPETAAAATTAATTAQATTATTTAQATSATTKGNIVVTKPQQPSILTPEQAFRFSYSLKESDLSDFENLLAEFESMVLSDHENATEVGNVMTDMIEAYYYISTQAQIALVEYYAFGTQEATDNYLYATEAASDAYSSYLETCRRIDDSSSIYKELIFAGWSEEQLAQMRDGSSDDTEYSKQSRELVVEYRALSDAEFEDGAARLFAELVALNNQVAAQNGYDGYMPYAYEEIYHRDYTPEDVALMREYVKEVIVPLCKEAYLEFYELYGSLKSTEQKQVMAIVEQNYDTLSKDYLTQYLKSLPEDVKDGMLSLFEEGNVLFADLENASAGAFTAYLTFYDTPICYFGPTGQDLFTVIHELGHYYHFLCTNSPDGGMDLLELHSQGNEAMFAAYLERQRSLSNVDRTVISYQLFDNLLSVITCTMIDEFEQTVYENIDRITSPETQLDAIMDEILASYDETTFLSTLLDMNRYWRIVVVEHPAYYISYAMSGVVALELYALATENYSAAMTVYCALVEETDTKKSFLEMLDEVGLDSPFEETLYRVLASIYV